jgi:hypothetical protein
MAHPFRSLPFRTRFRSRRSRWPPRITIALDGLKLHRFARQAIDEVRRKVEVLDALVGLLDGISADLQPGDEADQLRAKTTMMRAALKEIVVTAIDAAVAVGQVRFVGQLWSIEVEDGPGE